MNRWETVKNVTLQVITMGGILIAGLVFSCLSATDANAYEYCRFATAEIPSGAQNGVTSTIQVDYPGIMTSLDIRLNISHNFVGALSVYLTHLESGQSILLLDRPGFPARPLGCPSDNINVRLTESAAELAEGQCNDRSPAILGEFLPIDFLSDFEGQNIEGTWELRVVDIFPWTSGTLNTWCIEAVLDDDNDGIENFEDNCSSHFNPNQENNDADWSGDACDECPNNEGKIKAGTCGCNKPDVDIDGDGAIDCDSADPARDRLAGAGILLVADSRSHRVMAFDPSNGNLIEADFVVAEPVNLFTPMSALLSWDEESILVTDHDNHMEIYLWQQQPEVPQGSMNSIRKENWWIGTFRV